MNSKYKLFHGTKEHDKYRITNWRYKTEIYWLEQVKKRIELSGKKCEIVEKRIKYSTSVSRELALFYSDGYFEQKQKNMNSVWVETKNNKKEKIA